MMARPVSTFVICAALLASAGAMAQDSPPPEIIEADGTVNVRAFELPPSSYLSEAAVAQLPRKPADPMAQLDMALASGQAGAMRARIPELMGPRVAPLAAALNVAMTPTTLGGIAAVEYTPAQIAPRNQGKVLLNLPGGGFVMGHAGGTGALESIPLAAALGIRIVSITYRQAPEHVFPAASEDVAAAYRALLQTYKPEDIGIFGCSAGGLLGAQAMAWFIKEGLPLPRALGIYCAGADATFGGDSQHWNRPLEGNPPRPLATPYFAGMDLTDPLISPAFSPDLLAKFPPTQFITASRAFEMSAATFAHRRLVAAGRSSQLLVWDGLTHAFYYDPRLPEAREAIAAQARFFAEHLGLELPAAK